MQLRRKKIWIDRFQTLLFLRIALYFIVYQAAVWAFYLLECGSAQALEAVGGGPSSTAYFVFFGAVFLVFIGFLFIYDAIQFAHRFVGPLYRIRKTIQAVAAREEVELVKLRKDDFLHELKDEFNEMLKSLEQRGCVMIKPAEDAQTAGQPAK